MLEHLKQRVIAILEPTQVVTLSTHGPAGIQAQVLPCIAQGLRLFVFVPTTSDHLYNLEQEPDVVATTSDWQLRGLGRTLLPSEIPADFPLFRVIQAVDYSVVEINPVRVEIGRPNGSGFLESIDIDDDQSQSYSTVDRLNDSC